MQSMASKHAMKRQSCMQRSPSKLFILGYFLLAVGVGTLVQGALPNRRLDVRAHREVFSLHMQIHVNR
jgi:hypothetical protein